MEPSAKYHTARHIVMMICPMKSAGNSPMQRNFIRLPPIGRCVEFAAAASDARSFVLPPVLFALRPILGRVSQAGTGTMSAGTSSAFPPAWVKDSALDPPSLHDAT